MDIKLETGTENPSLSMVDIERYKDGSGYAMWLLVRSGWISAEYKFSCEASPFRDFVEALKQMDLSLSGIARLKPIYESQFIELEGNGRGQITVRGELMEHSEFDQRVSFEFTTDQTCLRPFIKALNAIHPA